MIGRGGLIILEAVVNKVHIAAAHQVVPPADLVPVGLVPGIGLGLGHSPGPQTESRGFLPALKMAFDCDLYRYDSLLIVSLLQIHSVLCPLQGRQESS